MTTITNEMAMEQFAKNLCPDVVVLEPESLQVKIKEHLEESLEAYKNRDREEYE